MSKRDRQNGDQPRSDTTRRDILTMSIAVAAFGAAMGVSVSPAGAEPADTFLKIPNVKGERANKQSGSAKKQFDHGGDKGTNKPPASSKLPR